ncbi:MAG: DUF885 domain-containing protein [Pseudomonadota bacterium]
MNRILPLFCLCLLFASCSEQQEASVENTQQPAQTQPAPQVKEVTETDKINTWFDEKYKEQMRFYPISKAFYGIKDEDYGRINNFSEEESDKIIAWRRQTLEELKSTFDYDALTVDAKDSYDLWVYLNEKAIFANEFRSNAFIFNQMSSLHSGLPQLLIAQHQVATVQDMNDYLDRIGESARAINQLIERSKASAAKGVHAPYFAFDFVIQQSRELISGQPFDKSEKDSPLWTDIKKELATLFSAGLIDEAKSDEMLNTARETLMNKWKPAYEALIAWQEEDKANATEVASGIGTLPNGKAYYTERLGLHTTTSLTAEEIHQIGLDNVKRIHGEMEVIKAKTGFEGTLQEFFTLLRDSKDDERFYFPNTDEGRQGYIDDSTEAIENIKTQLSNYFGLLPKADIVVKRVEAFRERPGAAQHYNISSPDGSRPGVYYAHLIDMKAMPKYELEVVAYHEGIPGHHMQLAIATELEGVPDFRKRARVTAYVEGWGLYSERLAKEMPNTYQDLYSDFGRLNTELWRAVRLVVDTGLHAKGWTEQEAIDYMVNNSTTTSGQAQSEIRRYIVMPGQATAYMIGMLKILNLRAKAEQALGDKFDIKAFHDTVLGQGPMPLGLLERKIDRWIAQH